MRMEAMRAKIDAAYQEGILVGENRLLKQIVEELLKIELVARIGRGNE